MKIGPISRIVLFLSLTLALGGAFHTDAASLTYTNTTNIYLSSPGITLTIQGGSLADGLVVNAKSVSVIMSNTTGGTFTLASSQNLSSSTVGSGGTLSQTCSSGIETDTITQTSGSETYTLTPTGSACSVPSSGGGGSGTTLTGGGGSTYDLAINGGAATTATTSVVLSLYGTEAYSTEISNTSTFAGATWIPYATTLPWRLAPGSGPETVYVQFRAVGGTVVGSAQASIDLVPAGPTLGVSSSMQSPPSPSLSAELKALQSELAVLVAKANQATASSSSGSAHFTFTRNLYFGITGNDVKELQRFLISQDAGPAARKLAVHGTTKNFATLTLNALIEFQKDAGIKPAIGYFGPITRAYVNNLLP
jgi:hypothetical protein